MPRTRFVLLLVFAVSLFLMPAKAVAGPPDGESGEMVVDEVWEGLRQYRKEKDEGKRIELLKKLAPTRDPRMAVSMADEMGLEWVKPGRELDFSAEGYASCRLLEKYFLHPQADEPTAAVMAYLNVNAWWRKNRDDLRRRAKQLPQ
jgi:hypothetical protein